LTVSKIPGQGICCGTIYKISSVTLLMYPYYAKISVDVVYLCAKSGFFPLFNINKDINKDSLFFKTVRRLWIMKKSEVAGKVEEIVSPALEDKGYELVEVEWKPKNGTWNLCLYIDKPGGVNIKDCEVVNHEISDLLDMVDIIPHSYVLEVSSPGVERPLKTWRDYEKYTGKAIQVSTYEKIDGQKKFYGWLDSFSEEELVLNKDQGDTVCIPFSKIARVKLMFRPDQI